MYIRMFLALTIAALSILPIINIYSAPSISIYSIYQTDILEKYFNKYTEKLGISTNPSQVIIGSDGWLYLGDIYSKTITQNRQGGNSEQSVLISKNINKSQNFWSTWLSEHNVKDYRIIIGPDKDSIYPDHYPNWGKSIGPSPVERLLSNNNVYVNVYDTLKQPKRSNVDLYFKTDTHWNNYGAGVAFKKFITQLKTSHPSIITPKKDWYNIDTLQEKNGGDLSSFLKVSDITKDLKPITKVSKLGLEHLIYDYETNKLVYSGLDPLFGNMNTLHLINTPEALNNKKILWLSDSFGNALSPYMTATFSNILKVHWGELIGTTQLQNIVKSWKPDFVFVTTVERDALDHKFTILPIIDHMEKKHTLTNPIKADVTSFNHVNSTEDSLLVTGSDPYIIFNMRKPFNGKVTPYISFNLICNNGISNTPIQIFWESEKISFNEYDSIKLNIENGINTFKIPYWADQPQITKIRIDLDGNVKCTDFSLSGVLVGK